MIASSRAPGDPFKPAFVIGVTGHMDIDPTQRDRIKTEVKRIFDWLRASPSDRDDMGLGPGLGLKSTPIILLSSLAPGADQLVVQAAREMDPPLRTLAPLPFLKDQYVEASTFKPDGVTKDEAASKFLEEFADDDAFVVRLVDELDLDDDALRAKHKSILTGSAGKRKRDRRYAAAGEYVAVYCDILIALTEEPPGKAGDTIAGSPEDQSARAIAELKRRGIIPGLLPVLPTLSWADNGPVIHVYTPRKPKEKSGSPVMSRGTRSPKVFYPYDCRPPGVGEEEYDNLGWRDAGHALLEIVAEHLERLNTEKIQIESAREDGVLLEMLPAVTAPPRGALQDHALPRASEHLKASLERLGRLRRRVADYSAHYNAHLMKLKRALFGLAFSAALFFSLADNWDFAAATLTPIFFLTALGLTVAAWVVYFRFKKTAASERCDDYRAIAEGLRVQFYWTACGSGESVASNYLQHQRGELGWIRNVISVAAFPYESNRVRYNELSLEDKRAALRSIRQTWIGGQYTYFKKTIGDLNLRREVFSTYAHVFLVTGFSLFAFFFFFAQRPGSPTLSRPLAVLFFAAGSLILAILYRETCSRERATSSNAGCIKPGVPVSRFGKWFGSLPRMLLPERVKSLKGGTLMLNGLLSIALVLLVVGTVYLLEGVVPFVPSAYKFGSVAKYLALAGGVLCGAWIEMNFFGEHIRHYASMASLFQAAGLRFDEYFSSTPQAGEEQREAVEKQVIANIQSLITAVGREALSENAEWLVTHRARPLEPVSV